MDRARGQRDYRARFAYVVEPVFNREELIVADLDFMQIDREAMTLDVSGTLCPTGPVSLREERISVESVCKFTAETGPTGERQLDCRKGKRENEWN